ncbi:fungal-specific transcription factor domain-containing protein [Phaeosphaeria sp. MPI-PUGE-AT-0046c]|nr:fungal-specific transcription factor domain-containing protein [Phaeosphaeria sp. MPI-PUGE-AT-0046c]
MRKPSACGNCRARRRKCAYPPDTLATVCEYCSTHGLRCIQGPPEGGYYAKRRAKLQDVASSEGHFRGSTSPPGMPDRANDTLASNELRQELIELYFDYIHDQFHSMYHRATFMEDMSNGRISKLVLFAMFALSARFSNNQAFAGTDPKARGDIYRVASEKLFSIRDITTETVQACILLGAYAAANGETDVENMYYSTGGRMCLALDLPNQLAVNIIDREVNLRTWWSISMVDVWSSTAVRLPRIMPPNNDMPLPMDDLAFNAMRSHFEPDLLHEASGPASALFAEMLKLNRILSRIIDFNQACVTEHLEGSSLINGVRALSRDLDMWLGSLPEHLRDTPVNFRYFASQGLGRMFAAVYLGYYHYGQLLNYQFLSSTLEEPSEFSEHADKCKHFAARLCSLVYRSQSTSGSDVLYSAVSHILVIASTVQIHTLLFSGDESEIRISKVRLERNFEILLRLRTYWPSVDGAMSRLRAFHQTCLQSKETSFVLDRWLLRFLVQFAPHMELEPRDNDPDYEALLALSKQSPLSCYSGLSM